MKRFVLVVVPTMENAYHNLSDFVAINPPMGLISIAASLEKASCEVTIIDGDAERLTLEETVARVTSERPDFVGSTCMTATMDATSTFYAMLKKTLPDVCVVAGGPHVSALPERTLLDNPAIDIAVIGEGDETIIEVLRASGAELDKVPGIAFRRSGRVLLSPERRPIRDLGKLPNPAYHLLDKDLYRSYGWDNWVSGHRAPYGAVFTGRGCMGKCNFCAAHTVFGRGIRYFDLQQIKEQIAYLIDVWKVRVLYFLDDTFTANRKMVHDICDYLIEKGCNGQVDILVSSRVDTVNPQTLQKMRQAGVRWICFGVESGNPGILNRMHKHITIEQIHKAFRLSREAGLFIAGNFMIGHLGETEATAHDTINLACALDQDYASFAIAIPLPGTELYDYCLETNIPIPSWNDFGSVNTPPIPLNPDLDSTTLIRLRERAVYRFFTRPLYIVRLLWRMRARRVIYDFISMYIAIRREKKAARF